MTDLETIPLFRTAAVVVLAEPTAAATVTATIEAQPDPAIIQTGLAWADAERNRDKLQAQTGHSRPMYGIGKLGTGYYIAQRDYYR